MNNSYPIDDSELHLFYNPYSNCSQRVQLLLAEKGLSAQFHQIDLLGGEQLTMAYRAINPDCDVPALVDKGKKLKDSVTIMRYLESQYPTPSFTPANSDEAKQMEQLLDSAQASHLGAVVPFIYASGIGRLPTPEQRQFYDTYLPVRSEFHRQRRAGLVANDKAQAKAVLNQQMAMLNERLSSRTWLTGDTYSLADMAWFANTVVLRIFGYKLPQYPHLMRWVNAMETREAYQTAVKSKLKRLPNWLIIAVAKLVRRFGNRA
jgi:glutathione S-transferase